MPPESWDQFAANIAIVFAAALAFVTIVVARFDKIRQGTLRQLDRRDSLEVSGLANWASQIWHLGKGETQDDVVARYRKLNDDEKAKVYRALNFYEDLCEDYLNRQVTKSIFRKAFAPNVIEDWLEAHALIAWLRTDDKGNVDRDLWSSWEKVARRMMQAGVRYTTWVEDSLPSDTPPEPVTPYDGYGLLPPD